MEARRCDPVKLPTLYLLCLPCYSHAVPAIYSYPLQKSEYGQCEGQIIATLAKGNKRFKVIKTSVADPGRFFSDPDLDPRIWF